MPQLVPCPDGGRCGSANHQIGSAAYRGCTAKAGRPSSGVGLEKPNIAVAPPIDPDWELADENGRTVAHVAAEQGHLPADFDQWELADKNGKTVAHVAAMYGSLPADFSHWELVDKRGKTVAHTAVKWGQLPPGSIT